MITPPLGIYVHFPWCVKKCPYCDFNSHPLKGELPTTDYLNALQADLDQWSSLLERRPIHSVFFGGGTPSLFPPHVFADLLSSLGCPSVEVTMEVNPGTAEFHSFPAYREAGINRLSFGAQSFNDEKLASLGRIHCADEIRSAFALARRAGFDNVNLDIMYGLPNQSVSEALDDLEAALALQPEHLSWYELTLEPKTEFHRRPPPLPREKTMLEIEFEGQAMLRGAGFERYEVSAWARTGFQCRHNLNYWQYGDYLGIGAGAHGKVTDEDDIVRTRKAAQPRLYLDRPQHLESTGVAPAMRRGEFLLNVLRLPEGVPWPAFEEGTGLTSEHALQPAWREWVEKGMLREDRIATTALGYRYIDTVLQSFL